LTEYQKSAWGGGFRQGSSRTGIVRSLNESTLQGGKILRSDWEEKEHGDKKRVSWVNFGRCLAGGNVFLLEENNRL